MELVKELLGMDQSRPIQQTIRISPFMIMPSHDVEELSCSQHIPLFHPGGVVGRWFLSCFNHHGRRWVLGLGTPIKPGKRTKTSRQCMVNEEIHGRKGMRSWSELTLTNSEVVGELTGGDLVHRGRRMQCPTPVYHSTRQSGGLHQCGDTGPNFFSGTRKDCSS